MSIFIAFSGFVCGRVVGSRNADRCRFAIVGHSSVTVTMRHYNQWVASRQGQADSYVCQAWK